MERADVVSVFAEFRLQPARDQFVERRVEEQVVWQADPHVLAAPLIAMSEQPNITVQLLPFSLGAHPGLYGPFVILTFPDPTPNLVWLENPKNSVYLEAADDVENYTEIFDQLRARALDPAETLNRVTQIIEDLEQ